MFLCCMMKIAEQPHHHICLTADFRSDLDWWVSFLPGWNGCPILPQPEPSSTATSDASGSWGCGTVNYAGAFFYVQWPEQWAQVNIAVKKMAPVVIAVALCSQILARSTLLVGSDNMSLEHAFVTGTAKAPLLMHLLHCLQFFTVSFQISTCARDIAGVYEYCSRCFVF